MQKLIITKLLITHHHSRAGSLVGRARLLHRRGREFESLPVHQLVLVFGVNPLVREGLPQRLDEKLTISVTVCLMGKYT